MSCPTEAQGVFYSTNMSKSLPFFKFNASEWLTGNISYEDYHVQGVFIRVCAEYWNRENDLTIEDAKLRTRDAKTIDYLIQKKYFKVKKNKIEISFLNEERNEIESKRLKLSESGRKGGLSRAKASLKGGSSIKNKNKEEDIDKERKTINTHVVLFEQTLRQLAADEIVFEKYMKRADCLLRTTQIFICICIILFSILFLNVFN